MNRIPLLARAKKGRGCMVPAILAVGILLAACNSDVATTVQLAAEPGSSGTSAPHAVQYVPKFAFVTTWGGSWVYAYTVDVNTGLLTSVPGTLFSTGGSGIQGVAVDPAGKFVFTANYSSNNVSAFTVDPTTGVPTLAPGSPVTAGLSPNHVTVHPSGYFLYVVNSASPGGNSVSVYTINGSTGALTQIAGSPFAAGTAPFSVAVEPAGKFAYVAATTGVHVYAINGTSGALAQIAGSPFVAGTAPRGVTVHPGGKFAYVTNSGSSDVSAFALNPFTGALTPIGSPVAAGTIPTYIVVNPGGTYAYVVNANSSTISTYSIDATSGALTAGVQIPTVSLPTTAAVDPSGKFLYVVSQFGTTGVTGYTIAADGNLTGITGFPFPGSNSWGVAVSRVAQ